MRLWHAREDKDPVLRAVLTKAWIEAEVARLTVRRARATGEPDGGVAKLLTAESDQRVWALCVDLLGPEGALYDTWDGYVPAEAGESRRDPRRAYLRSRALTIQGGTAEITRTLLAERVLGLPVDPRG